MKLCPARERGVIFPSFGILNEARLANLLKLLVVLICLAAILQPLLPLAGINWL
ncbi:hypothetical protein WHZ78_16955 [Bradyrhizobium symbiodeficiens]|uniref:hypothetical protein n=1 Tax=Bradyrhizobium symbiodeficiens TaxID=1404367 RepID=UPI0030CFB7ED